MNPELTNRLQEQLAARDSVHLSRDVRTLWRIFSFDEETGEIKTMREQKNLIPFQGADILARALAGDLNFKTAAMLFEYENTAGAISIPTPIRDEGIDYYLNDLPLTSGRDYLRIPLVVPAGFSSSDAAKYDGNQVTFFAVSSGSEGIHGEPYNESVDSHVYGVGLVATPTPADFNQDRLFSRSYTGFDPVPKEDGHQVGAQYMIRFL